MRRLWKAITRLWRRPRGWKPGTLGVGLEGSLVVLRIGGYADVRIRPDDAISLGCALLGRAREAEQLPPWKWSLGLPAYALPPSTPACWRN